MNGDLRCSKLLTSWECPNQESHTCSLRQCPIKKKAYRQRMHLLRKEKDNEANLKRYHERYKVSEAWMKKRRASWRKYAAKMGSQWIKERNRKYKKPYSELSQSTRSKIRKAYSKWAKEHWNERVKYAREHRRKKPTFGFKAAIADARRSGDFGKLAQVCLDAIIRAYD